jgi:GAF domain-containing protein
VPTVGVPVTELELAQMFAEMASTIDSQPSVAEALEQTVGLAVDAVQTADLAGVSWCLRGKPIETPYATDPIVAQLDTAQYELGEGPAVDAEADGVPVLIADTRSDTRWPRFSERAAELGIRSVLSCQLSSPRRMLGALNLYSREAEAFDAYCIEAAQIYASHASIVLASRTLETDLRAAIDTRGTIGQAMGILIERHKVDPRRAFDMLVKGSQRSHRKLRDLADYVVQTGVDPSAM